MGATLKLAAGLFLTLAIAGQLFAAEPPAAEPATLDALIQQRAQAFVGKSPLVGIAVGIVDGDQVHCAYAGHRSFGSAAPDERTLFEIGSITKTFTGILLADAVDRSEVKLDQPVVELLGLDSHALEFKEHPIRLVDLATQTSGLPRLPSNLGLFPNPLNPYAGYTEEDLTKFLSSYKLTRAPGEEFEYSNLGMGLLGQALAKRSGMSYEELLRQRICDPLGLSDTVITLSDDQQSRFATGTMLGIPVASWDIPALPGCGAIRTSLHDMLTYLRANLYPESTPLAKDILLSHEPRFTIHKSEGKKLRKLEIALAWLITTEDKNTIVWHNGRTGGYTAYLACIPAKKWGIVVLANRSTSDVDELGNDMLKEFLNKNPPAP